MPENEEIYGTQIFTEKYVHHKLLVSKYTAVKRSLDRYLATALSIYAKKEKSIVIKDINISLSIGIENSKIFYVSGVALRLSKSQKPEAMKLANAIASHLSAIGGDVFKVQIVPPGWIYLQLTDSTLAAWLQSLAVKEVGEEGSRGDEEDEGDKSIQNSKFKIQNEEFILSHNSALRTQHLALSLPHAPCPIPNWLFAVQYAHARCCSLLLLGHREGLIKLRQPVCNTSPAFWSLISPNPVPWLNCDGILRLNHSDEHRLIAELLQVVDNIECFAVRSSWNWEKAALKLSQAFENFWRNCRIWGDVKITSLELAQARLGLLVITQSVLRFLLEEKLRVFAPLEL